MTVPYIDTIPSAPVTGDPAALWPGRADEYLATLAGMIEQANSSTTAMDLDGTVALTGSAIASVAAEATEDQRELATAAADIASAAAAGAASGSGLPPLAGEAARLLTVIPAEDGVVWKPSPDGAMIGSLRLSIAAPGGTWLLCDGSTLLAVDYPDLVGVLEPDGMGGLILPGFSSVPDLTTVTARRRPASRYIKAEA